MINDPRMTKEPVTVTISDDPATLGSDAVQSDLDRYAINLAAHLNRQFNGLNISVVLGSVFDSIATDALVEEHVREIDSSDEWTAVLLGTTTIEYYLEGATESMISKLGLRTEPAVDEHGDVCGVYVWVPARTPGNGDKDTLDELRALTGVEPFYSDGLG
jgi:hypothetical protein